MKKALITGSSGLVGSTAVEFLCQKGFNVVGIDNDLRSYLFGKDASTKEEGKRLQIEYKNFKLLSIDIRDEKKIVRAFKEEGPFDFIIHAAAQPAHEWSTNHALYRPRCDLCSTTFNGFR